MNKFRQIANLISKNKQIKLKIQILRSELNQNTKNIDYLKDFNKNSLYFLKDVPKETDVPLL